MRGHELIRDLYIQYLEKYPNASIDFKTTTSLAEDTRHDFIQFLGFARNVQVHQPIFEAAYQHLIHYFVLSGSRVDLLAALNRRLRAAIGGQSSLVLIEGVAGIGKTSLAMAQQAEAQELGAAFVVGHCYEQGTTSFWLWQEVVHSTERLTSITSDSLPAPFGKGVEARSVHHLIQILGDWLIACATVQPLVILLDDLHWADSESLEALNLLMSHVGKYPILFMATYRPEETHQGYPLYSYLPMLHRNHASETLHLIPLTTSDIAQLVTAYYGPCHPKLAAYLYHRADGHPLFTLELLRDLADQGLLSQDTEGLLLPPDQSVPVPTLLRQVIMQRIARLGEAAEKLLLYAAIVGETWNLAIVEKIVDLPEDILLDALQNAVRADIVHVINEQAELYRFSHGLIQDVLYTQQLVRRRKRLHARVAVYLEDQLPLNSAQLAYHFYVAELWGKAFQYSRDAGDEAQRRFGSNSALSFYQQALNSALNGSENIDPAAMIQLYERIGRVQLTLEQRTEAELTYSRMRDTAVSAGDVAAEGRALAELASVRINLYQFDFGEQTALNALKIAETIGDQKLLARIYMTLSKSTLTRGKLAQAKSHSEKALQYARAAGDISGESYGLRFDAYEAIWRGRYDEAERLAQQSLALAYKTSDFLLISGGHQVLSYAQIEMGRYVEAHQTILSILNAGDGPQAHHHQLPRLYNQMGYLYLELDDALGALTWDQHALAASRNPSELTNREMERYSLLNIATDLLYSGQWDEALGVVAEFEAIKDMTEFSHFRYFNRYQLLMTEIHLVQDEFDLAIQQAREARELAQSGDIFKNSAKSWLYEGQALLGLGRFDAAFEAMQEAVGIADQIQHGSLRWKTRLQLARAYAQAGRANTSTVQKALELVDSVVHDLQGSDLAPIFARSAPLQALKYQLLVTQPRTRSMTSFPAGLTQREVEVLRLVARGATNQQIANALTISPRTVNTHITNILNKTNCENRTAASAFAVKHNLVTT